jgi:hypothetical protein
MANVNAPSGFTATKHATGGVIRPASYYIAGALASNIYRGSMVIPVNTNKRINVAAAGNRLIGSFDGCSYVDTNGDVQFRPRWATGTAVKTGTVVECTVFDDPFILFACQVSSATGLLATDVGNFADLVVGTGNATTGQSADMLDQTTLGTTDGQLRIEELYRIQGNDFGQYAKALVRINEHYFGPALTAI